MKIIPRVKCARIWIIALIFIQLMSAGCTSQSKNDEILLDGERLSQVWVYDTGAPINLTPVHAGEIVITVPSGGSMLALEVSSGDMRWEYDPPEDIWERGYTANENFVYVGLSDGKLVALNTANGEVRWEQLLGINVQTPPLITGDMLYVSTTFVGPGLESDPHGNAKVFAEGIPGFRNGCITRWSGISWLMILGGMGLDSNFSSPNRLRHEFGLKIINGGNES